MKIFLVWTFIMLIAISFISCGMQEAQENKNKTASKITENPKNFGENTIPVPDHLDTAIKEAIISKNKGNYLPGEFQSAGSKVIEIFTEENMISVYALTEYAEFRFEDDEFVRISGTNPKVLMRFDTSDEGKYKLIFYTRLDEFSDLPAEEIEQLLEPLKQTGKKYIYSQDDLKEVGLQIEKDAFAYLDKIERQAEINLTGEHKGEPLENIISDENLLSDLSKDEEFQLYPDWIGNIEYIENGVRYICQTDFDKELDTIIYTKKSYATKEILKERKIKIK